VQARLGRELEGVDLILRELSVLYMIIERFTRGAPPVYERAAQEGRLLPDGLRYLDSWVDERLERCFQLMETHDARLFDEWIARWSDLADFEVVPVIGSAEAAARVLGTTTVQSDDG
jgi:hypothetical protein